MDSHRKRHRQIEQRRREKINQRIGELKELLPPQYGANSMEKVRIEMKRNEMISECCLEIETTL